MFNIKSVQIACDDSNLKNSEAWESPGPLRLLPILKIFQRTLGLQESPSGLGESWATDYKLTFFVGHPNLLIPSLF